MKVLVVDDNNSLAFMIQEMLVNEGHEVRTAPNGATAYLLYLLFRPDLIITDIEMPEKEGPQMIKLIRVHDPKVRTIYMSGNLPRLSALFEEEKTNPRISCLPKPFSRSELVDLVSEDPRTATPA